MNKMQDVKKIYSMLRPIAICQNQHQSSKLGLRFCWANVNDDGELPAVARRYRILDCWWIGVSYYLRRLLARSSPASFYLVDTHRLPSQQVASRAQGCLLRLQHCCPAQHVVVIVAVRFIFEQQSGARDIAYRTRCIKWSLTFFVLLVDFRIVVKK